jgi:hypothetical protein
MNNEQLLIMLSFGTIFLLSIPGLAICTSCITTFKRDVTVLGNFTTKGSNITHEFPYYSNAIGFSFNVDENCPQITTDSGNLRLNPTGEVSIPYGKSFTIGDIGGFDKLYLSTVGGSHSLVSTNRDLRITTNRNLEIKASNTIFPAVNSITYLFASNSARYNELRACYGTSTGSTKYTSIWHDGTNGNVKSNTGILILSSTNNTVQVNYNLTIGTTGFPGCLQMRDSDDNGWTKCTTLGGVFSCSTGTC